MTFGGACRMLSLTLPLLQHMSGYHLSLYWPSNIYTHCSCGRLLFIIIVGLVAIIVEGCFQPSNNVARSIVPHLGYLVGPGDC